MEWSACRHLFHARQEVFHDALRQRMFADMQLRGLAPRTQGCYVEAVLQFARHVGTSPDLVTEEELRAYFRSLINEQHVAPGTRSTARSAIKFLYVHTLQRPWPVLDSVCPRKRRPLPAVLSVAEVRRLLGSLRKPHHRVCLTTIYAALTTTALPKRTERAHRIVRCAAYRRQFTERTDTLGWLLASSVTEIGVYRHCRSSRSAPYRCGQLG